MDPERTAMGVTQKQQSDKKRSITDYLIGDIVSSELPQKKHKSIPNKPQQNGESNAKQAHFIRDIMGLEKQNPETTESGFKFHFTEGVTEEVTADPPEQNLSVFVGGMPYSWTPDDVHSFWSECGEITEVDCMAFHDSGRFNGIAKITYKFKEGQNAALECHGESFDSFSFVVTKWKQKEKLRKPLEPIGTKTEGYDVLFMCNLPRNITESEVADLFKEFKIASVKLKRNPETSQFKGYAHIHFGVADHRLEEAIEKLDGTLLRGRVVRIGYAVPPPDWSEQKSKKESIKGFSVEDYEVQEGQQYLLLVSGLHPKVDQEDIEEIFKGAVFSDVVFLWNSKSKKKTGSLYLLLTNKESLQKVLRKDRTFYKGRRLHIRPGKYDKYLKQSTTKTKVPQKEPIRNLAVIEGRHFANSAHVERTDTRSMSLQHVFQIGKLYFVNKKAFSKYDVRFVRDRFPHKSTWRPEKRLQQQILLLCSAEADRGDSKGAAMASELKVVEQLDRLIDALLSCKSREELAKMVGENLLSFQQNFWLRLAARADSEDPNTKSKMEALSRAVMTLTEAMVKMADEQLKDSSELVTKILTSAADERGEWELPLAPDQLNALKQALLANKDNLDEAFLATVHAWMRKSAEDQVQGMVSLLQRVLQLYAAEALQDSSPDQVAQFVNKLMNEDPSTWTVAVKAATATGYGCSPIAELLSSVL
eukprot:g3627.t1